MTNEQLCIAALEGDIEAKNSLVENNLRFIRRTAYEIWSAQQELDAAIGIEINDLVQERGLGPIGLYSQLSTGYRQQVSDLCGAGDSQFYGELHTQL